jgi:hypothetical protein
MAFDMILTTFEVSKANHGTRQLQHVGAAETLTQSVQENAMKNALITTLSAVSLLALSATVLAQGEVVVVGTQPSQRQNADQKATNACVAAFFADLFPGRQPAVRTVTAPGSSEVFGSIGNSPLAPYKQMEIEMTAHTRTGELLASSVCVVSRSARIVKMTMQVPDRAKLAGLQPKDLKIAMIVG